MPKIKDKFSPFWAYNMIGEPFIILPTIDSTNNYAKALIKDGLTKDGMVIFTEEQTQGRGQKNHIWESTKGENIMMSGIIDASWLTLDNQFQLSCATALACNDFFSQFAGDETCIKWPNDLYWRDRKAGGILIENIVKGNIWEKAIIGIGININQVSFPTMNNRPVSLKQITGKTYDPHSMAKELCNFLAKRYQELKQKEFKLLLDLYNQELFRLQKLVTFKKGEEFFSSTIVGVNEHGQLMVLKNKELVTLNHGEVEWIL